LLFHLQDKNIDKFFCNPQDFSDELVFSIWTNAYLSDNGHNEQLCSSSNSQSQSAIPWAATPHEVGCAYCGRRS
jgi:hypothetical protein